MLSGLTAQSTGKLIVLLVLAVAGSLWMLAVVTNFRGYRDRHSRSSTATATRFRWLTGASSTTDDRHMRTMKVTEIVVASILLVAMSALAIVTVVALVQKPG
jgi:hypothetical protein